MFSPVKFALFALISFVALALATHSPGHPKDPMALMTNTDDPRALITSTNRVLEKTLLPLHYINSANATSEHIAPIIQHVGEIVEELIVALRGSSLSSCDCTAHDIVALIALMFKIIFEPFGSAYQTFPPLVGLLGRLVKIIVKLLDAVFQLVGVLIRELLYLLISNGSAGTILNLRLTTLIKYIDPLSLGGLGGALSQVIYGDPVIAPPYPY